MANLSSVSTKITVEATRFRSAVSEFLAQTMGKSINFLIDETVSLGSDLTTLTSAVNGKWTFVGGASVASGNDTVTTGESWIIFIYNPSPGSSPGFVTIGTDLIVGNRTSGEVVASGVTSTQIYAIKFAQVSV
jgi:hypothetical protein